MTTTTPPLAPSRATQRSTTPFKRTATLLLSALTALLVLFGFVSPAQAAGTPITISNLKFNQDTVASGQRAVVSLNWAVDLERAANPVSFTIPIEAPLSGVKQAFPMKANGVDSGTCTVTYTEITCTVDAAFVDKNPKQIAGTLEFSVDTYNETGENQTGTVISGDLSAEITVRPDTGPCTDCVWEPDGAWKGGWYEPSGDINVNDRIDWYVYLPDTSAEGIAKGTKITVTEELDLTRYKLKDGSPTILWATQIRDDGREAWGWDTGKNAAFQQKLTDHGNGKYTLEFTTVDHQQLPSSTQYSHTLKGGVYAVLWQYEVLDRDATAIHRNTAHYTIDGRASETTSGQSTKPAGGATVVGTNDGRFTLAKQLDSSALTSALPTDYTFAVTSQEPGKDAVTENVVITAGGAKWTSPTYPRDTTVKVVETTPGTTPNIDWSTAYGYRNESVTGDLEFTIAGDFLGDTTDIVATNTASLKSGQISLKKSVVAPEEVSSQLPDTYSVTASWVEDSAQAIPSGSRTVDLPVDGTPVVLSDIPVGATVTFEEGTVAQIENHTWAAPVFSQSQVTLAEADQVVEVTLTNTLTKDEVPVEPTEEPTEPTEEPSTPTEEPSEEPSAEPTPSYSELPSVETPTEDADSDNVPAPADSTDDELAVTGASLVLPATGLAALLVLGGFFAIRSAGQRTSSSTRKH